MPDIHPSEQTTLMRKLVELSVQRSELSAERSYMNAERTLSVWIRTALSLMILGIAIDRFGLRLREVSLPVIYSSSQSNALSMWSGLALVALGVFIVLATGILFLIVRRRLLPPVQMAGRSRPVPRVGICATIFGIALLIISACGYLRQQLDAFRVACAHTAHVWIADERAPFGSPYCIGLQRQAASAFGLRLGVVLHQLSIIDLINKHVPDRIQIGTVTIRG